MKDKSKEDDNLIEVLNEVRKLRRMPKEAVFKAICGMDLAVDDIELTCQLQEHFNKRMEEYKCDDGLVPAEIDE